MFDYIEPGDSREHHYHYLSRSGPLNAIACNFEPDHKASRGLPRSLSKDAGGKSNGTKTLLVI